MTASSSNAWNEGRLLDVTLPSIPIRYGIVQPGPYVRDGVPVVAIRDLPKPSTRSVHRCSPIIEAAYRRSRVQAGDILISVKGTTGRVGIVPAGFQGNISRDVARVRLADEHVPAFWFHLLQSFTAQRVLQLATVGSTRQELSIGTLKQLSFRFPSPPEQERIARVISDIEESFSTLERLISKKQAIRMGLIQRLLKGVSRLPGFTKPWEFRAVPEVMRRLNVKRHHVLASSYSDVGRLPVVDQGQKPVVGFTNDLSAEFDPGQDGVIVFGDHTCITKFVDFRFAVGAEGTQLLKARERNSTRFFAYALEANPVTSTGYNRHFKFLRDKVLPVPDWVEQQAIVATLRDVDHEVEVMKARLSKARDIKAAMLQQFLTDRTHPPVETLS